MNKSESKYFNTALKMDNALIALLAKKDFQYITVKEICQEAGVNRSTFYLHYDTIGDLLSECVENIKTNFFKQFNDEHTKISYNIDKCPIKELIFISPKYLIPYLDFVKNNRAVFLATFAQPDVIGAKNIFNQMFEQVINPVMERFNYSEKDQSYFLSYYIHGLQGIVKDWVYNGCKEDVNYIANIMIQCVIPDGNGLLSLEEIQKLVY
ncbi:MAG: TetR/AcrR family transcriptional regulator [Acutalibacteraceae bacterium]